VPRTRPPYPEEFRRVAGRQAAAQAGEGSGISDVTLRHWLKEEKAARGERPGGLSQDERGELARLRDENATLRMEREILRKVPLAARGAAAFAA
jgi:transposase